jgi:hypothetical protein
VLSFDDEPFPGNQVAAIVLDSVFENTYYEHDWKPGHIENPTCYAFGRTEDELGPHPAMQDDPDHFVPQHDECAGCPMAEWGSAKRGTGKACQQRRRLFMVPAGMFERAKNGGYDLTLVDDPEELAAFDPALLKVPVTSDEELGEVRPRDRQGVQPPSAWRHHPHLSGTGRQDPVPGEIRADRPCARPHARSRVQAARSSEGPNHHPVLRNRGE